ncbi:hypothetical protein HEP75_04071 [Xanthomonas sp. SI]|nr:hypothetical protein HEP75_04071 [Xanthomonas sp. SI]
MSRGMPVIARRPAAPVTVAAGLLQRKCACGNHTAAGDSCDACRKKKSLGVLRYASGTDHGTDDLAVSQPGDALEREADAAADRIVGPGRMPSTASSAPEDIGSSAQPHAASASARVASVLGRAGNALPPALRQTMEEGFGRDFSRVRIHHDAEAAHSADAVGALAYTVSDQIVFGRGQFMPDTHPGQRLLAHELAHVVQQSSGRVSRMIARDTPAEAGGDCVKGRPLGEAIKSAAAPAANTPVYRIWGAWREGDNTLSFLRRTLTDWIKWRFGGIDSRQFAAVLDYGLLTTRGEAAGNPGCQVKITVDYDAMSNLRQLAGEAAREKRATEAAKAQPAPSGDGSKDIAPAASDGGKDATAPAPAAAAESAMPPSNATPHTAQIKGKPGQGMPALGDFGQLGDKVAEDRYQDEYRTVPVSADATVMRDPKRAELYLAILEQYHGRSPTAADHAAAADGLDQVELEKIIDGKPMRRVLTALFGQGFREFEQVGGSELDRFSILIQIVCEQFTRGNPTATHNQLQIGKGFPEQGVLGIVERGTGLLLYTDAGIPLAGLAGVGFRDKGFIATKVAKDAWGLNIANVADPGLRSLLNALRQTFGDPMRMAVAGAEVYFNNIELVNGKVQAGLAHEVKQKFVDMLPFFIGFIAGHAVSALLMRVPNPYVASVGIALKGLLTAAGYVMEIDFAAGAMQRLLQAAAHLSKFERNDRGEVSALSESHLNAAAKLIQDMVAEIAAMFATMALGKLISGAHSGLRKLRIECTHCALKGPGTTEAKTLTPEAKPEAKGEAKAEAGAKAEAKGETKTEAQLKPEAKQAEATPVEKAKQRLQELGESKSGKRKELADLRQRRSELLEQRRKAVGEKDAAIREWDAAKDHATRDAARDKARAANERATQLRERLDALPSEEGVSKDLKRLDTEIGIENIKADPNSRGTLPCFAPDTPVWTSDGPRPISELRPGDRVWAWDFATGTRRLRPVLQVHRGLTKGFRRLTADGMTILATRQHRFWVESDLAWRTAESLMPGAQLRDLNGHRLRLLGNEEQVVGTDADTFNLTVEELHSYYVGAGVLVHNGGVDIGLGGDFVIYRGTNVKYPGQVYIGQTTQLDVRGAPRGDKARELEHQKAARRKLADDASGIKKLSARDKAFYEFMEGAKLEPIVEGIGTQAQADYLEQRNIELERQVSGKDKVMNRRNEITNDSHMKAVVEAIKADPAVKAKGYCP